MSEGVNEAMLVRTKCLGSTLFFTRYFYRARYKSQFVVGLHHVRIANALDRVLRGQCKRLIINISPRYGKTELAVKSFIALGLAMNPRAKFIHLSYSDELARSNSSGVQEILATPEFAQLFSECKIATTGSRSWSTTAGGGVYAVSSAGQVTGFGAGLVDNQPATDSQLCTQIDTISKWGGAIIIDDPIKPDDARSATIREKVNQKFESTIRNRVNSRNTPIIIIMQRLDENDLCGYLMKTEPDEWEVLSLPCIYTDENGEEKALWEFKHTLEELHKLRQTNRFVFETQYMQNPQPLEGLMYEVGFREYEYAPPTKKKIRKAYVDTADTGKDYLCCIIYDEADDYNYILDVIYTQSPMEVTEPMVANALTKYEVEVAYIESNNGGRGFARNVESQMHQIGNNKTYVKWFHQGNNKESRIFSQSSAVQNITLFPKGWKTLYPQFASAILGYMKTGTNAHDDAPDALTGTIEKRNVNKSATMEKLLQDVI